MNTNKYFYNVLSWVAILIIMPLIYVTARMLAILIAGIISGKSGWTLISYMSLVAYALLPTIFIWIVFLWLRKRVHQIDNEVTGILSVGKERMIGITLLCFSLVALFYNIAILAIDGKQTSDDLERAYFKAQEAKRINDEYRAQQEMIQ